MTNINYFKCKYCGEKIFKCFWNGEEKVMETKPKDRGKRALHSCSLIGDEEVGKII